MESHSFLYNSMGKQSHLSTHALPHTAYSSSSSTGAAADDALRRFFLLTRPAPPPPNGDLREKSMCFWESRRTMKLGMFTTCLRTLRNANEEKGKRKSSMISEEKKEEHKCCCKNAASSTSKDRISTKKVNILQGEKSASFLSY